MWETRVSYKSLLAVGGGAAIFIGGRIPCIGIRICGGIAPRICCGNIPVGIIGGIPGGGSIRFIGGAKPVGGGTALCDK